MKKLFIFVAILSILGLASYAFAEMSASGMSGNNYREQQVFVECYNGSGSDISSNYVVILDTTGTRVTSGSTLGAYITTTTTANDARVIGVTDETIVDGARGRVCVRGPHKCYVTSSGAFSVGATLATTTTAGAASQSSSITKGGEFAVLLSATALDGSQADGFKRGFDGANNYWIWIGKA